MEYYLLKQSSNVINPIKILNMDSSIYTTQMSHKDFKQLDKVKVAYIQYEETQEIPDILNLDLSYLINPTYLIIAIFPALIATWITIVLYKVYKKDI